MLDALGVWVPQLVKYVASVASIWAPFWARLGAAVAPEPFTPQSPRSMLTAVAPKHDTPLSPRSMSHPTRIQIISHPTWLKHIRFSTCLKG